MRRALTGTVLLVFIFGAGFRGSWAQTERFIAADIRPSAAPMVASMVGPYIAGSRFEVRAASVLDFIRTAYGMDSDQVFDGPSWVEAERFDLSARAPADAAPEAMYQMLRNLLADRFKLSVHNDTRPLPAYVLVAGKKPLLKPGDASAESGCKLQPSRSSGNPVAVNSVEVAAMVSFACRNMTMEAFASEMAAMTFVPQYLHGLRVVDRTGLKGSWNFDLSFSRPLAGAASTDTSGLTLFEAIQKQLGIEMDLTQVPMPVLIVDAVTRKPTDNPTGATDSLQSLPLEFEVASIKPSAPDVRGASVKFLPSGQINAQNQPLRIFIDRAWKITNDELLIGPKFMDTERFDIVAKAATLGPPQGTYTASNADIADIQGILPMLQTLLIRRFKMVFHYEERPVAAFRLIAAKPKLQRADPSSRTACRSGAGPDGKDPRFVNPVNSRLFTCVNTTMTQFAASLEALAPAYIRNAEVVDETGLEDGWNFTLNFSPAGAANAPRQPGDSTPLSPAAIEPNGAITLAEALEKQLGLKLEAIKRPGHALVIDHIEQQPIDD